jgi:hypothetical protein
MSGAWPTMQEVRNILRLQPDPNDDSLIITALAAAVDFGMRYLGGSYVPQAPAPTPSAPQFKPAWYGPPWYGSDPNNPPVTYVWVYTYPPDTTTLPDAAHEACLLHAARLYRRRDSLDGTLFGGDLTIVRVGNYDPDVLALYGTLKPVVFA